MTERRSFEFEDMSMRAHATIQAVQTRLHQALVLGYMSDEGKRVCASLLGDAAKAIGKLPGEDK